MCFSCGRARMKLYYLSGERIGGRCVAYRFTGIYLDGTLAHTHRRSRGMPLGVQPILPHLPLDTAGRHVGNSFINAECAYVGLMNERLSDLNFSTVVALRPLCRARSGSQHLSATYASTGTSQSATQSSFAGRIVGSLKLDSKVYEEVEHDATANTQVIYIIALVSAAQAVGAFLTSLILQEAIGSILVIGVAGFITTFIGLALWSYLLYLVGTRLFKGTANSGETWRCAGFARSPGLFQAIPFIGVLVTVWMVIAQVIAAKASLDLSTGKAVAASIVSFIPYLFIQGFISLLVYGLL